MSSLDNIREEINTAGIHIGGKIKRKSSTRKSRGGSKINYRGSSKAGQPSNFADGAPWAPVWNFKNKSGGKKSTKKGAKKSTKGKKTSSKKNSKKPKRGGSNKFLTFNPKSFPQGTTDAVDIQMASTASPNTSEEQTGGLSFKKPYNKAKRTSERVSKGVRKGVRTGVRKASRKIVGNLNRTAKTTRNITENIGKNTIRAPKKVARNTEHIANNAIKNSINLVENVVNVPIKT